MINDLNQHNYLIAVSIIICLLLFQAKKIEEHERNVQRRKEEKEIREKKERIRKAREAREKAAEEAKNNPSSGGMPGGMDDLGGLGT